MTLAVRVAKRLPRFRLDVDFLLEGPGIHALVGPSGAGKTTVLRLVAGLERAEAGSVVLDGAALCDSARGLFLEPWRRPVGMVFQDFHLFPHLSLLGNVLFATRDRDYARELMCALGVWELRGAMPGQVSGGERQRCAVCQALARRPGLLLLDEPFSALDPPTRRTLGELLRDTAHQFGVLMLLVTHDLEEALRLSGALRSLVAGRLDPDWLEERVADMERDAARSRAFLTEKHTERRM